MVKFWWSDPVERVKDGHLCYLVLILRVLTLNTKTPSSLGETSSAKGWSPQDILCSKERVGRGHPQVRESQVAFSELATDMVKEWKRVLTSYPLHRHVHPIHRQSGSQSPCQSPGQPPLRLSVCGMEVGRPVMRFELLSRNWKRAISAKLEDGSGVPSSFCLNAPAPFADFFAACTHPGFSSVCPFQKSEKMEPM